MLNMIGLDFYGKRHTEFDLIRIKKAHAHATMMAAFEFGYATVKSVDEYLSV